MTVNEHKVITEIAVRYLDAARVLHKNSTTADTFWEPQNHLFAMAAELALKAFLERVGVSEKELKRKDVRHSLNSLLLLAISKGLRTTYEVAEVLMRWMQPTRLTPTVTSHARKKVKWSRYTPPAHQAHIRRSSGCWTNVQLIRQSSEQKASFRRSGRQPPCRCIPSPLYRCRNG